MNDANLAEVFTKAREGDEAAIVTVVSRCEKEVRTVVREMLPRLLRSRFDSTDFLQAVWTSVLVKEGEGPGPGPGPGPFENSRHVLGYLAGVARNKVREEHRRQTTRKYDMKRNQPLYTVRGDREVPRELPVSSVFSGRQLAVPWPGS